MEKNLQPKQNYLDLYDRHTVELCRNLIRIHETPRDKKLPLIDGKEPSEEMSKQVSKMALEWALMFETGNRYIHKEETIERMMAEDQEKDRFYESAQPPEGIRCLTCHSSMSVTLKNLTGGYGKPLRVLFMYDCPNKCLPRRAFYNNGEEWRSTPDEPCPKCRGRLNFKDETTEEKFITLISCASCDYTKTEEIERTTNKDKPDLNFEVDRDRFCLSKEKGERWRQELLKMEQMGKLVEKWKEEDKNKELYDKVAKIQKLTILDLEKLLIPALEKEGYVKLQLSSPEIGKDVIVPFGVHDSKSERSERASMSDLKRLLKKTLESTNWRLMSDGVGYRLGFLSGRLRGYERREDFIGLVK